MQELWLISVMIGTTEEPLMVCPNKKTALNYVIKRGPTGQYVVEDHSVVALVHGPRNTYKVQSVPVYNP